MDPPVKPWDDKNYQGMIIADSPGSSELRKITVPRHSAHSSNRIMLTVITTALAALALVWSVIFAIQ